MPMSQSVMPATSIFIELTLGERLAWETSREFHSLLSVLAAVIVGQGAEAAQEQTTPDSVTSLRGKTDCLPGSSWGGFNNADRGVSVNYAHQPKTSGLQKPAKLVLGSLQDSCHY